MEKGRRRREREEREGEGESERGGGKEGREEVEKGGEEVTTKNLTFKWNTSAHLFWMFVFP